MLGVIYCFLVLPIFCLVPVSVRVCLYWWVSVSRSLSFSLYLRSVSMIIFSNLSTTPFALPIALSIAPDWEGTVLDIRPGAHFQSTANGTNFTLQGFCTRPFLRVPPSLGAGAARSVRGNST